MGKVRIKQINLTETEEAKAEGQGWKKRGEKQGQPRKPAQEVKVTRAPGLKGGERVVSAALSARELEAMTAKMKPEVAKQAEELVKEKPPYKVLRNHPRVVQGRSRRYQAAVALVDRSKLYEVGEAIGLLKKIAHRQKETLEAHLRVKDQGLKGSVKLSSGEELKFQTEKKQPLIHAKLGQLSKKLEELQQNLQALVSAVGRGQIAKLTVCSTQSPSIRVDPSSVIP